MGGSGDMQLSATYDPSIEKFCVVYRDSADSNKGKIRTIPWQHDELGSVTTNTFESSESTLHTQCCYHEREERVVVFYAGKQAINLLNAGTHTNLVNNQYLGIANAAAADNNTATIQLATSVDDAQSGLSPGGKYYMRRNGTLSTDPDYPVVFAGTAVSATQLVVKG